MATSVFAREPDTTTCQAGFAFSRATARSVTRGNTSTSLAISAAICAAGSLMKRNVTCGNDTEAASRNSGHACSVSDVPRRQLPRRYGPVPTGCAPLPAALEGSTITAVACPSMNRKSASGRASRITTVCASFASTDDIAAKNARSLFTLSARPARSKLNFTAAASQGFPFWNFTPGRRWNVHVSPSSDPDQRSASSGDSAPFGPTCTSVSNTLYSTTSAMAAAAPAVGSSAGGSSTMPSTSGLRTSAPAAGSCATASVIQPDTPARPDTTIPPASPSAAPVNARRFMKEPPRQHIETADPTLPRPRQRTMRGNTRTPPSESVPSRLPLSSTDPP